MTTRDRKIDFIKSFGGPDAMLTAITEYYYQEGANWLTDEQLEVMVINRVEDWKQTQRRNRQNREVAASARRGRDEAA